MIHHLAKGLDTRSQANKSKLAEMLARASNFRALAGMAVDVVGLFTALLSSAQGEQRRSAFFDIRRDIGSSSICLRPLLLLAALEPVSVAVWTLCNVRYIMST